MSGTFDSFPAAFLLILYRSTVDRCEVTCPPWRGKETRATGKRVKRRWGPDCAIGHEKRQRPRYSIWWDGKSRFYRNALIRLAPRISRVSFFVCYQSPGLGPCVCAPRRQLPLPPDHRFCSSNFRIRYDLNFFKAESFASTSVIGNGKP